MKEQKLITRHSAVEIFEHWVIAISGLALLLSGMFQLPVAGRYKITAIPGFSWSGDFFITLQIHYLASVFFVACVVFHVVYHCILKETGMLPRKGDIKESIKVFQSLITKKPEPPFGKYLPEQRLAYVLIAVPVLLLIVSGIFKTAKNIFYPDMDRSLLLIMTSIHNLGFVLFFLAFFAHIGALLLKPNWPLVRGIFTGKVRRDYAEHRHPLWIKEIETNK
ncbi:MAG: cytochrome b/b6 domain-containing protein [Deltaproteobacteria bacterium]|nr:cytochrome b/b6 domain-containing protein [Deltaproteobacteria bacterium]